MPILTALATALLVVVGIAQIFVLMAQKRQSSLNLIETYRVRWSEIHSLWAVVVYFGRNVEEYYQVANKKVLKDFANKSSAANMSEPTLWALEAVQAVCIMLSDVCLKVLQGHVSVEDTYSVFGSGLLRHSRPLRIILDNTVDDRRYDYIGINSRPTEQQKRHFRIRNELQDWLIYHDGVRRRCLILIDLLWAEAARLEDLPPDDLESAADAKERSGHMNISRIKEESWKLGAAKYFIHGRSLSHFLRHAEYKIGFRRAGIRRERLEQLKENWTNRLLREFK